MSGRFDPAAVVVSRSTAIRVHALTADLGDSGISPLTYSETDLRVTVSLTESQARELAPGTPLTIALPNGSEIPATMTEVDPGGAPTADGETSTPSATVAFPDQAVLGGARPGNVRITIALDGAGDTTLVVPVNALLATPGGGHEVETWDGTTLRRVPVEVGRAADARVQVLGGELAEGDRVVLAR